MAGTTVTVENPDLVEAKSVDGSGRVYLGKAFANGAVRLVVERLDDEAEDEPNPVNPNDPIFDAGGMFSGGEPHDTSERVDEFVAKVVYEDAHGDQ